MEGIQPRYHIERYTRYHIERYKWYHIDRYERYHLSAILIIIQKLLEQQANGMAVYVYVRHEGYDEQKFKEFGGNYTVDDSLKIQCAIIDKSLCWYGDINFLGYHAADNTVMRIDDANIAGELLDMMSNK